MTLLYIQSEGDNALRSPARSSLQYKDDVTGIVAVNLYVCTSVRKHLWFGSIHFIYNILSLGSRTKLRWFPFLLLENIVFVKSVAPENAKSCLPCSVYIVTSRAWRCTERCSQITLRAPVIMRVDGHGRSCSCISLLMKLTNVRVLLKTLNITEYPFYEHSMLTNNRATCKDFGFSKCELLSTTHFRQHNRHTYIDS